MIATADSLDPAWVCQVLTTARWFSGKGRGGQLRQVRPLSTWSTETPMLRSWSAKVEYLDGSLEEFHLLVEHTAAGPREATVEGWQRLGDSVLHGLRLAPGMPEALRPGLPVRLVEGEQTHTSVMLGSVAILKLYRTLEPTLVVTDHADRLHDAPVPRRYLLQTAGRESLRLLTVSQQIPDATDGWELATRAAATGHDFQAEAHQLGTMLRQIHHALSPSPTSPHSLTGEAIAADMQRRLAAATTEVPALGPQAESCHQAFDALTGRRIPIQAIHGDAHLGQVLRDAQQQWWLTDFDGEPLKPAAERHAPDAVARDVAGMLQSFDYAARTSGGSAAWAQACQNAFLTGYQPKDDTADLVDGVVLRAYALDKAIYNVIYETRNRPDWVPIALSALTESLAQQGVR